MAKRFENLLTRRVLVEKMKTSKADQILYCYTLPSSRPVVINPFLAQIKQLEMAIKISERLCLKPIEYNEGLSHHTNKKVLGTFLIHLLKRITTNGAKHVFVKKTNYLSSNQVFRQYIYSVMAKHNVCLYDEAGEVEINYINFDDIKNQGFRDYQIFLDVINDIKNSMERFRY